MSARTGAGLDLIRSALEEYAVATRAKVAGSAAA
jgi:hypothetical protein